MESVTKLNNLYRHFSNLSHIQSIMGWDEAVMMPAGGTDARADALAELAVLVHERYCSPEVEELVNHAEKDLEKAPADSVERLNLREFRRELTEIKAFPKEFVERRTRARIQSENAWRGLRPKNDWAGFLPHLKEVLSLEKQAGEILAAKTGRTPYNALLRSYNPDLSTDDIDPIFKDLKSFLPKLIQDAVERRKSLPYKKIQGTFRKDRQKTMGLKAMELLGFDFNHGRLDESHHPFCGGVPADVRITTRYAENEFTQSLMGIVHETGHGLYEQGLPKNWRGFPIGHARGMALHESQSLFFEMQIARSLEFSQLLLPQITEHLSENSNVKELTAQDLYLNLSQVQPSYIRVDADEVTYPCHVILRYEIEKALFAGDLTVDDIPDAWDEKMQTYLGLSTKDNYKNGCLQDVHWPAGIFGYFPSYTLGALLAAQLFAALEKEQSNVRALVAKGEFAPIKAWLDKNVWSVASSRPLQEIVQRATGNPLGVSAFKKHVERRYL